MGFHYRFKPDDFSLKPSENSHAQIKSKTIYISPTTKPSVETNMFQVNFRANPNPKPKPLGCQWVKNVAVNQGSVPCLISNGNEDGEYFVNFNQTQVLTQESSIVISITNDIGTSNFTFDLVLPELYLEIGKKRANDSIEIDLEKTNETSIDCVAVGVYSKPEFKWFLANKSYDTAISSIERSEDDKVSYISTLTYEGSSKDLGKILKCEIHQIHTKTELQIDIIEATAELNLM